MKSIQVHCAPPHPYYYFDERIRNNPNECLVLLPVNRAVRIFKSKLLEYTANGALADPAIYTFDQLLLHIYSFLPDAKRVLSQDMLQILIGNLLENEREKFSFFSRSAHITSGMIHKITQTLSELRRFGYDGNEFSGINPHDKTIQPQKYADFEYLLKSFEKYLGATLIDESFAKHFAASRVTERQFRSIFPEIKNIYVSGYGLFTPAMYKFIEKASNWVPVHIKVEFNDTNPALFQHTQPAIERFDGMGANRLSGMGSSHLAQTLFNRDRQESGKTDLKSKVEVLPLLNRKSEVEFIAAEIRRSVLQKKIPLARIAVTFSNLDRYIPLIQQVFGQYGIPYNLSTGFSLKQSSLIQTFLQPLKLIESGYEWNLVRKFLTTSFVIIKPIDLASIHPVLLSWRLRKLRPGWQDILTKSTHYKRLDEYTRKNVFAQMKKLDYPLQLLYDIPKKASIQIFKEKYVELLKKLGLLKWYEESNEFLSEQQQENEFRAFNRFMKLLDQLVWMEGQLTGSEEITLEKFNQYLEIAIGHAVYNLTEWPDYGVQIMPRLEVQAVEADIFFLGGLTDGEFPRGTSRDVFFNDSVREKIGLVATEELLSQDRFIFYSLLDAGSTRLVLTYPKYENERVLVPSTFISDLKDVAKISEPETPLIDHFAENEHKIWQDLGHAIQQRQFDKADKKLKLLHTLPEVQRNDLFRFLTKTELEVQRILDNQFGAFEGVLTQNKKIVRQLQKSSRNRDWSASRLETYAFCPMQYYFRHILNVAEDDDFENDLTALERGSAIHDIFNQFYSALKEKGEAAQPLKHQELLINIADQEFAQLPFSGFFWEIEKRKYFGDGESGGLFEVFLINEQMEIEASGFVPAYFEYAFGGSAKKKVSLSNDAGKVHLQGRIDRIDINSSGQAMIIDYKTGTGAASQKAKEVHAGLSYQLSLYMLSLMQERPDLSVDLASYYIVKDSKHCERVPYLADAEALQTQKGKSAAWLPNRHLKDEHDNFITLNQLLEISLGHAIEKVNQLQQGNFRHTLYPNKEKCTQYCPYKRICQKNSAKIIRLCSKTEKYNPGYVFNGTD